MSVFGGKLITTSRFTGDRGIVTGPAERGHARSRPRRPGRSSRRAVVGELRRCPPSTIVDRVEAAGAAAPIEEARIIVAGGRGVGGPDGFGVVEELADGARGAVGATRAAVDAGWIPYAQQIGQTGKIVKPALYLALGISGAIQHKVGMQTAEHDRRRQPRPGRADRRVRRPGRHRRPVRGRAGASSPRSAPGRG